MIIDLRYQPVAIPCPQCGFDIEVVLRQITEAETVVCPGCLVEVQLVDDGGSVMRAQHEVNLAVTELCHQFKKIGGFRL